MRLRYKEWIQKSEIGRRKNKDIGMENNENKTSIRELGKFGLISHITSSFKTVNPSTIGSIGDDSSVIETGSKLTLVSTDLLLEGIHFNLIYTPLKHLGYKAVIRGISDIYAMNGTPSQVLISLGISSRFTVEMIEELYEGINHACEKYCVDLAGGDTTSSLTGLTIGVTAVGSVEKPFLVKRNGAQPNDLICVTGDFGAAFMGLQLLERERKLFQKEKVTQPDLSGFEYLVGCQLKPEFPAATLKNLLEAGILPTSMIDVTEGLASDLLQICKASNTGSRVYYSRIPVDYETSKLAEEFNIDPITPALNGGEDYELLFTIPLNDAQKVEQLNNIKIIGYITETRSGNYIIGDDGSEVAITAQGWENNK
jgi:thiamine-monophosphate kinase